MPPAAPPPGFISTGNRARDRMLIKRLRTTVLRTDPALPSSMDTFHTPGVTRNTVPEHDIPVFPPLPVPQTPGFVFTGDVILDQWLLEAYLKEYGTQAERDAVEEVWQQRLVCLDAREDLYEEVSWRSEEYKKMMMVHLGAIVQNARATQRAAETHGQDDEELARMCMEGVWAGGCECDSGGDLSQVRKGDKEKLQPAWRSRISLP
ncbi:hypothetical protein OH76DRAFT_210630 [Lentinus brumalis]|uniref:Uncharacterized protein n=1 Tax=Lentinus brumalis TaxID=2498619 RepID=A0A371DIK8_9APHY|nr:hypothetical protein OH76DRAFT_210630 [Polyporus brumalis]